MLLRHTCSILFFTLAFANPSFGVIWVWQNAEPLTSNTFVQSQGNLGSSLFLRCDATAELCKWRITTRMRVDSGYSTAYSLWIRDPAGAATQLSISETSFVGAPHATTLVNQENTGFYLSNIFATVLNGDHVIPAGPTIYNLHSYVLTSQAGIAPGTLTQLRGGSDGFFGFEPADPFDNRHIAGFGANPGFQIAGGEWPNPVIHINYVPEPTTAAMLLAPAVLLLRRQIRRPANTSMRDRR
ncbi:MAG: hypothetical protein HBSAPP02_28030 [Phycisphaerae bacterium]|nr:MAG: hypothetical protein HRU71_01075 [Planctomycetia bacterium]GJQ27771.1 MAG: hypothetical protein HBSAPP02_28030 [Phycisphaerae bacterium]